MGYASTNIVMYGVTISAKQAEKLAKELKLDLDEDDPSDLKLVPKERLIKRKGGYSGYLYDAECRSHGTDSRIDSNFFDIEQGTLHTFGIYCGSNGYAYEDDVLEIIKNVPKEAKANFRDFCRPTLERIGITDSPEVVLVTQTW